MSVKYKDMLGGTWKEHGRSHATGIDCVGVALEIASRMGAPLPEDAFSLGESSWTLLGRSLVDVTRAGDIILTRNADGGQHVSIALGGGQAISAYKEIGVKACQVRAIRGDVLGVYRWGGDDV